MKTPRSGEDRPHSFQRLATAFLAVTLAVFFAARAQASFSVATIDSSAPIGYHSSLAVDAAGHLHASFYDGAHTALMYGFYNGSSWSFQTVDSGGGDFGYVSAIAVDVNANPAIAYYDFTHSALKYARFDGVAWSTTTVDSGDNVGYNMSSIALDQAGLPHISYYDVTTLDLKYAHYDGTAWTKTTVDATGSLGAFNSLALDAAGKPQIAYSDLTNNVVKYAAYNGTSWVIQASISQTQITGPLSLALDAGDNGRVVYMSTVGLRMASFNGGAWSNQTVDAGVALTGYNPSLALDGNGRAHVAYENETGGGTAVNINYALYNGVSWSSQTVTVAGATNGKWCSLALDKNGNPNFTFYDNNGGGVLKFVQNPSEGSPAPMGGNPRGRAQAPTGLFASVVSSSSVAWSWTRNSSNELGFALFGGAVSTGSFSRVVGTDTVGSGVVSYTETGLSPGTTYFRYVAAVNAGGVAASSEASVMTLAALPSGANFSGAATGAITLTWSASGNPAGTLYTVLTSTAPDPSAPAGAVVTTSATYSVSLSTGGLAASTTYYFRVAAANANGVQTAFTAASATATLAAVPSGVSVSATSGTALVSWSASGNGAGTLYTVLTSTAPNPSAPAGAVVTASATYGVSASTSGLNPSTTYYFQVAATNPNGIQTAFTAASATATLAALPTGLSFSGVAAGAITANWSSSGNGPGTLYSLLVTTAPNPSVPAGAVVTSSATYGLSLSTAGLNPGTTYYFAVSATNVEGVATSSGIAVGTATLAAAPSGLGVAAASAGAITVSWLSAGNGPGTSYTVLTSTAPDPSAPAGAVVTASATYNLSLSTAGLAANATCYFEVAATNPNGVRTAFTAAVATATLAAQPTGLGFGGIATGTVTLAWSASGNSPGTLYTVLTSTAPDPSAPAGAVVTASATYNVSLSTTGLGANTTYYFRIAATNVEGLQTAFTSALGTATLAAQPAGVGFGGVATGAVTLTWSASGNPAGTPYTVLTSTAPNPSAPVGAVVTASATYGVSLSTAGLNPSTTYYFQVAAANANGVSSAFTSAVGTATLAAVPSGVSVSATSGTALVSWASSGNGPGTLYTVLTSTAPNPSAPVGAVVTASATYNLSLSTAGLGASATYYFQVAATNPNAIQSAFTSAVGTATLAVPPSGLSFGAVAAGAITASWSSSGNGPGTLYTLSITTAPDPSAPAGAVVTSSSTYGVSLSTTGLSPSTTYYFAVSATNVEGVATSSGIAVGTATLAAVPSGVGFAGVSTGAMIVSWASSGNGPRTLYVVLASTAPNPSAPAGAVVTASATYNMSLSTAGLAANTTCYFQVAATNPNGIQSAFTSALGTATLAAAPSGLSFGGIATGAITLAWSASGNGPGALYTVLTSTAPNPSAPAGAVVTASATYNVSLSTAGLGANTTYYFQIAATNVEGVQTAFTSAFGTATLAALPSGLSFGAVAAGAVALNWSASGNGPGTLYTVLTSTAPNPSAPAGAVVTASSTYNVSLSTAGLGANTTYYFQVAAANADGVQTAFSAAAATATPAAQPSGVGFGGVSTGAAVVTWSSSGNGAGTLYTVLTSTAPDPSAPAGAVVTASATYNLSLSTAGLAANATYYFEVAAANAGGGRTAFTAALGAATLAAAPAGTAASAVYQSSAAIAWSLNGNPSYTVAEVQRSTDAVAYSRSLLAAATSFTDATLGACTTYYFRVRNLGISGAYTSFDSTLQVLTAPVVPHPAEALSATPAAGGRVALAWTPSPTPGVVGYKLYYDGGTGTVSYAAPLAVFTATETSFTTAVLPSSASYAFALRADHLCGNEETAGVFAAAGSTAAPAAVSAYIKTPDSGQRVAGNSLTVVAALSAGTPDQVQEIYFQYRPSGAGAWTAIPAANVNHPNPVLGAPYFIQWDAGALASGSYDLRAQAVSVAGSTDAAPSAITIIVDPATPDINENLVAGVQQKVQTLSADIPNAVQAADASAGGALATISVPAGALSSSSVTLTAVVDPVIATAPPAGLTLVGSALQADLGNGQHLLLGGLTASVTLSYPAAVGDPSKLQIWVLDPLTGAWSKDFASTVDAANRTVTGFTPHFSVFVLVSGVAASADLSGVRAYPVPYKPNGSSANEGVPYSASDPNSGIVFDRLPSPVTIRIYTMTGRLVAELADSSGAGRLQWDVRTGDGRGVASGGYIAVISSPGLKSVIKKLAVIR